MEEVVMSRIKMGCIPTVLLVIIGVYILCLFSFITYIIYGFFAEGYITFVQWDKLTFSWFVFRILPVLVSMFIPIYLGLLALSFFPIIHLKNTGVIVRSLLSKTSIRWDEIENMKPLIWPEGVLLVINRKEAHFLLGRMSIVV